MDKQITGNTSLLAQKCMVQELRTLFAKRRFKGQQGEKELNIYEASLPVDGGDDDDADTNNSPAPFIVVLASGGAIRSWNKPQEINMVLTICCYDEDTQRDAYDELQNIKESIVQHFCKKPYFGGAFTVICDYDHPISWEMQMDDTHPYYFAAAMLDCTAPAMTSEESYKDLI